MRLLEPLEIRGRAAPSRVVFGPHVTNLGDDDRRLTRRHVAYYERRARGGAGIVVVEGASVHPSDWPYERAPLAERCADGWAAIVGACRPHGALVLASLDHAGGQGSSAYSQAPLWAPSRVPEVNTREVPKWMEADDIAAVIDGFAAAAKVAVDAGCDGVEINAGQHSLVRQFLSGLTNHRDDEWGADRLRFAREVVHAVRDSVGDGHVVSLRLSCDELAPWAGITPEMAPGIAAELTTAGADLLVVVRGAIFSIEKTRPDFHEPTGFNIELTRAVRAAVEVPVVLQGSIVEVGQAEWALGGDDDPAAADAVEMTRAQLADPDLVAKVRAGTPERVRPCTRCNQTCQVRDARNPIVTCIAEPTTGRETEDPDWTAPPRRARDVVVVGGGPAGLETARVAAMRGHRVTLHERDERLGGLAAAAGPNAAIVEWLIAECEHLGVEVVLGSTGPAEATGAIVVQCTGSLPGRRTYEVEGDPVLLDIADLRRGDATLPPAGTVVVHDPIGGPIAVALAEELGDRAVVLTQDNIAGNELARTGDLAPANVRLAQRGVRIERRTLLRTVRPGAVDVQDRFSGERRTIECVAVVDCGFRLPDDPLPGVGLRAGDCVAPRTLHEAILEGRRVAHGI
ncbi:MAG: mycofactocin system FadH/OYE family oxidoreductase 1 [Ilumatobacteraceae bacterium]|nr:mycofactocin system FadH/OYE family oxidoreductase 1 [Ilumatobacteraceae bacterium]